jgi:hypothetical protein
MPSCACVFARCNIKRTENPHLKCNRHLITAERFSIFTLLRDSASLQLPQGVQFDAACRRCQSPCACALRAASGPQMEKDEIGPRCSAAGSHQEVDSCGRRHSHVRRFHVPRKLALIKKKPGARNGASRRSNAGFTCTVMDSALTDAHWRSAGLV